MALTLFKCCGANCPGLPYPASEIAHPSSCVGPVPAKCANPGCSAVVTDGHPLCLDCDVDARVLERKLEGPRWMQRAQEEDERRMSGDRPKARPEL